MQTNLVILLLPSHPLLFGMGVEHTFFQTNNEKNKTKKTDEIKKRMKKLGKKQTKSKKQESS